MRFGKVFILLQLFVYSSGFAQTKDSAGIPLDVKSKNKNDLDQHGLRGQVKEIRSECYMHLLGNRRPCTDFRNNYFRLYNTKGYLIVDSIHSSGFQDCNTRFIYSNDTSLLAALNYYGGNLNKVTKYQYDSHGYLELMTLHYSNNEIFGTSTYQYDTNGNVIESVQQDKYLGLYYKDVNKYNDSGLIVENLTYNENRLLSTEYWKYYEWGYETRDVDASPMAMPNWTICKYNSKGQQIEEVLFIKEKVQDKFTRHYNEKGLLAEENASELGGFKVTNTVFKYLYDEQGNWIKKDEYTNGHLLITITRQILYFP